MVCISLQIIMQPEWDVMLHTATKQMRSTMMIPHHLNPPKLHLPWLVRYSSNCLQGNLYEFHISTTAQVLSNTVQLKTSNHSIHHTCNDDLHTGAVHVSMNEICVFLASLQFINAMLSRYAQIDVDVASGTTQSWSDCCSASLSLIWHCGMCLYFGHHKSTAWNPQLVLRPSSLGLQNANCKLFPVLNSSAKHWVSWVIPLPSSAPILWASRTTWKTRRRRPPAPEVPGPGGDGWDLWLDEVGW